MSNKRLLKFTVVIISSTVVGFLLIWTFVKGKLEKEQELESEVKVESHVSTKNGRNIVTVDNEAINKSGIVVSALESIAYQGNVYGVFIPDTAVIWSDGKAWAYIREDSAEFARYEIPTDTPIKDGWFVSSNDLKAGALVVVSGAQLLLLEEFRSKIQVEKD